MNTGVGCHFLLQAPTEPAVNWEEKETCDSHFYIRLPLSSQVSKACDSYFNTRVERIRPKWVMHLILLRKPCIFAKAKVKVLVAHLCPTLCNPMDCSPPGSFIQGILQARILEWVAIPFSRGSSRPRVRTWVSSTTGRFFTVWATR